MQQMPSRLYNKTRRLPVSWLTKNGEAVIGANVIQKGTTNGTITDIDGKFTLEVPAKAVLTVSFIGYQSQDVALKEMKLNLRLRSKMIQRYWMKW